MSQNLHDVKFDFIRYANCWEDAGILLEGLAPREGSRLISICSAGDNTFSLLTSNPAEIIAVDINQVQLWLTTLKMAAIKNLNREEYLGFAGFTQSNNRWEVYNRIKKDMNPGAVDYWNNHRKEIEKGIIYNGKFERYFNFFAHRLMPLMHTRKRRTQLFENKPAQQQLEFYERRWNNARWKLFFKLFFSKRVMGKFGRDPKFLEQVNTRVSDYIYKKAEAHLVSTAAQQNYMLHFIINGSYGHFLPHYVQPDNYEMIQSRMDKIKLHRGFIHEIAVENGKFDGYNLSDIFEYLDEKTFEEVSRKLISSANKNASFAYWNLMVPRSMPVAASGKIIRNEVRSVELTKKDNGFFYNTFNVDVVA